MAILAQMQSPIYHLLENLFEQKQITVHMKRDDLMFGPLHGNKFRKLKYHLETARQEQKIRLLTFGGPFSNHLYATAAAGVKYGFDTLGIVRGGIDPDNPTIRSLRKWNMKIISVSRMEYRRRHDGSMIRQLLTRYPQTYVIPEGGNHPLAIKGVSELVDEVLRSKQPEPDFWVCPLGTGATSAGIARALPSDQKLLTFSVLKGVDAKSVVANLLDRSHSDLMNVIGLDAALNGFGKRNQQVEAFIQTFYRRHKIIIDPIYLGKTLYKLYQLIESDFFAPKSKLMIVHTGGLQGIWGYNYLHQVNLPEPDRAFFDLAE